MNIKKDTRCSTNEEVKTLAANKTVSKAITTNQNI